MAIIKVDDETLTYKLTLSRQTDLVGYALFINHFAPALVGVQTWQSKRGRDDFGKIMTPSDEALLLVVLDGNYDRWLHGLDGDGNVRSLHARKIRKTLLTVFCLFVSISRTT